MLKLRVKLRTYCYGCRRGKRWDGFCLWTKHRYSWEYWIYVGSGPTQRLDQKQGFSSFERAWDSAERSYHKLSATLGLTGRFLEKDEESMAIVWYDMKHPDSLDPVDGLTLAEKVEQAREELLPFASDFRPPSITTRTNPEIGALTIVYDGPYPISKELTRSLKQEVAEEQAKEEVIKVAEDWYDVCFKDVTYDEREWAPVERKLRQAVLDYREITKDV